MSSLEYSLDTTWKPCAEQGEHCAFSGVQAVRYGAHDEFVVKTAEDGMHCTPEEFDTAEVADGHCEIGEEAPATEHASDESHEHADTTETADAEEPAAGSNEPAEVSDEHEHAETSETASAAAPASQPAATPDPHAAHSPDSTAAAMPAGPFIDKNAAFPVGEPGSDREDIGRSSERPVRADGVGAFRTVCDYSHMNYDDPIVFPGQPGKAHLHAFFGNVTVDAMSTEASIRDTGKSTCRGGIVNRTAYWVPAVIDKNGKPVKPKHLETYYKSGYNGVAPSEVKAFPPGLRMIAGDAKSSAAQQRAYWGCHANYIGHPASIPNNCPAGDTVVMMVEFPQCWDGKNLDSADHKSHMAYPAGNGCPSTHPVPIPAITMNVLYDVPSGGTAGWRLASDMYDSSKPGGMSAHADWFEGWDPDIVKTFIENCVNPGVDCHSHLLGDGRTIN